MASSRKTGRGTGTWIGNGSGGVIVARLAALVLLAGWAFVAASMIGFDKGDAPTHLVSPPNDPTVNWCGPVGASVAYHLIKFLGFGAYLLVFFVGLGLFNGLMSARDASLWSRLTNTSIRFTGLVMFATAVAGLQNLLFPSSGPFPGLAGGQLGVVAVHELGSRFGQFGTALILLVAGIIGAVVAMDEWMIALMGWTWSWTRERAMPVAFEAGKVATVAAGSATAAAGGLAFKGARKASGGLWSSIRAFVGGSGSRRSKGDPRLNDLDDDLPPEVQAERPKKKTVQIRLQPKISDDAPEGVRDLAKVIEGHQQLDAGVSADEADALFGEEAAGKGKKNKKKASIADDEEGPLDEDVEDAKPSRSALDDARDEEPEAEDDAPGAPQVYSEEALREKIAKLPVVFGQQNRTVATDADLESVQGGAELVDGAVPVADADGQPKQYKFPGMDLLENPEENFNARLEEYVRDQATALESALQQYRIAGEVVGIESGPVITLYDVRLAPGTKVAAIEAVSKDLARALKAINIRIVPNQVGRDTIGIEVPNATKEKVRLKELMSQTEKFGSMKLPMFLGKDASGESLIEDLTKMPHMLIAGTTGSGKSVCMNTIIMSFLYTKKPSELKLVLVDPKMVEMSQFKDIPHLMCPVVTEMSKAAAILEWACAKMDERYELLAEAGCRDIASYNDLAWEELKERFNPKTPEEEARIPRKLPYMVFLIDELADLMMTAKEVESHIIRIAQKARAVGIHLILATQRPQANVVTGLIKSNMPCRVAFKVASGMDSRIVLDQKGGELLLGHGDMLFLSPRSSKLTRAQGTLVDDLEIRRVVRFMREIAGPSFERQLLQIRKAEDGSGLSNLSDEERLLQSKNNSSASLAAAQEDPLFPRAVEIVLETRRGSVSLLQRRLAIGYTRASRLIDLMGIAGIISDHKGSVARDVLITEADWDMMKKLAAEKGVDLSGKSPQGSLFPNDDQHVAKPGGLVATAMDATTESDEEAAPFDADDDEPEGEHEGEGGDDPNDDLVATIEGEEEEPEDDEDEPRARAR